MSTKHIVVYSKSSFATGMIFLSDTDRFLYSNNRLTFINIVVMFVIFIDTSSPSHRNVTGCTCHTSTDNIRGLRDVQHIIALFSIGTRQTYKLTYRLTCRPYAVTGPNARRALERTAVLLTRYPNDALRSTDDALPRFWFHCTFLCSHYEYRAHRIRADARYVRELYVLRKCPRIVFVWRRRASLKVPWEIL